MNDQGPVIAIPTEGRTLRVFNDLITIKLRGTQTQRAFSLFFVQVLPGGGVRRHTQLGQETFILFEGELEFSLQDGPTLTTFTATPGTVIHVPEGVAHGYRNASEAPAAFFVFFTPSGSERFFERLGVPVTDPNHLPAFAFPDPASLGALLEEFGVRIVSPLSQ
jgi:quercetin dioxygenase-like cupin family protein